FETCSWCCTEHLDVGLHDPPDCLTEHHPIQGSKCIVRTASTPKAKRALREVLLIDSFQHFGQRALDDLILDTSDSDRPPRAWSFGDVHPSDRLMAVPTRLQLLLQGLEVAPQALLVLLPRDAVHTYRRILANAMKGSFERVLVNQAR